MTVTHIQFPALDLLEEAHRRDVLVGTAGVFPTIEQIAPQAETRPANVFAEKDGRLNRRAMIPRSKAQGSVVRTWHNCACAESQCGQPGPIGVLVGFVKNLIPDTEGRVH